ncbi:LLM class flavin-dependent oxidoreductase [Herbidospora cretacea]|uniref:LLM class flavin-dependent oxidoreductase n=1 Tax=Herbidospora cretacea TaxID=28444 RepID=UPI000AE86B58|nr:LLM class flavin-dependent oxidoreductase [Herbidospora cretacea]
MRRGISFGVGVSSAAGEARRTVAEVVQADHDGLDHFSVSDHPYVGDRLDAYSIVGFALGATTRISGLVNVTNLPTRPAPMLARTVTSLSSLSEGRIILGMGAGGLLNDIARVGAPRHSPAEAVRAFAEGITLVRALSGGGDPVTFEGEFYQVTDLAPGPAPAPPIWTGSNGPKSLAVTGRLADGWIPGHAADWLSDRYRWSRPLIDEAASAAGRDPADVVTVYNTTGRITSSPLKATRDDERKWLGGSAGQWIEELTGAVLDHGAAGFTYFPADDTMRKLWAQEIVPAVRAAVS